MAKQCIRLISPDGCVLQPRRIKRLPRNKERFCFFIVLWFLQSTSIFLMIFFLSNLYTVHHFCVLVFGFWQDLHLLSSFKCPCQQNILLFASLTHLVSNRCAAAGLPKQFFGRAGSGKALASPLHTWESWRG